jgi:hypothetical protein
LPVAREVKMEIPAMASHPCTLGKDAESRTSHAIKTRPAAQDSVIVLVVIVPCPKNKSYI